MCHDLFLSCGINNDYKYIKWQYGKGNSTWQ
jgi:hypothetical protein